MKKLHNHLTIKTIGFALCFMSALSANAQRTTTNSGGGSSSGSRTTTSSSGGGGGGHAAVSSPAPVSRSNNVPQHSGTPSQGFSLGNVNRQGSVNHGNYGLAPRQGVNINRGNNSIGNYAFPHRQGVSAVPAGLVSGSNTAYAQRVGVLRTGDGGGVRTVSQVSYGNAGYWGNHGYYHYNQGYYKSYYAPRLGFACTVLPYGYYPFFWGDDQYYYSDGLYYQYQNEVYTVVEPPIGAEIASLPEKAQSIVINGQQYYELDGVYYQPYTKDDGTVVYVIAGKDGELNTNSTVQTDPPQGPRIGDIVNQLPPNCRKVNVNGQKLYVSEDGVYYQQQVDEKGAINYKIVGLPSDDGSGQN
jgi:hypothetical protein